MHPNVGAKINMLGQKKTKIQNMRKSNNLLSKKQKKHDRRADRHAADLVFWDHSYYLPLDYWYWPSSVFAKTDEK